MAKQDARDWIFEVQTAPTTWVEIDGLTKWELDPNANGSSTEDTTFRSAGQYEGHAAQRGASIKLEGFREVDDEAPYDIDPGQAAVDDLGDKVGRASKTGMRFRHVDQTQWSVWPQMYVEPGSRGGGMNDNTSWEATLIRSGAATTAVVA